MRVSRWVVLLPLGWYALHPLYLTILQWYEWSRSTSVTHLLVTLPLPATVPFPSWFEFTRPLFEHTGGYFAFYSLGRFWQASILSVFVALLWWGMIRLTQVAKLTVFSKEDAYLAFLAALVAGWPRIIVFVPLFVVCTLFFMLFHKMKGTKFTSLLIPLALAALGALASAFLFPLMI